MSTICSKFSISRATVHRIWRSRGLPPRQRGLNETQKDEAKTLYLEGKSLATLGKLFDVSPSTVRDCLLRQGVTLRPRNYKYSSTEGEKTTLRKCIFDPDELHPIG